MGKISSSYLNFHPTGRVLEWFGGRGFIGFRIYNSYDLALLTFNDINPSVVKNFNKTLKKATKYFIGHFNNMPKQKFDLILENSPNFSGKNDYPEVEIGGQRIIDENWNIHKDLFLKT